MAQDYIRDRIRPMQPVDYGCNLKSGAAVLAHPEARPRPTEEVTTMSAYATARTGRTVSQAQVPGERRRGSEGSALEEPADYVASQRPAGLQGDLGALDVLITEVAERVAAAVVARLGAGSSEAVHEWLDSRRAAEYLGVHRDTLRKLAAERAIPAEQDGPGCKLFFRRSDLDAWRQAGGRAAHLFSLASAA